MSGIFLHGEVSDANEVLARAKEKSFVLLFFQKTPQKNTYNFVNEPPETRVLIWEHYILAFLHLIRHSA